MVMDELIVSMVECMRGRCADLSTRQRVRPAYDAKVDCLMETCEGRELAGLNFIDMGGQIIKKRHITGV